MGTQITATTATPLDTSVYLHQQLLVKIKRNKMHITMATTQGQGIGAFSPYITQAGAYSGPQAYQSFTSPYQQDVIDATLAEYDTQTAAGLAGIGQQCSDVW